MIPAQHPPTFHLKQSDPRCDTFYVLRQARLRRGWADCNACPLLDDDANVHWPDGPAKNQYDWIWTGRRDRRGREIRREMSPDEKHRPTHLWTAQQFLRWRRGPKGGPKPKLVRQRQRQAALLRVKIAWDVKGQVYGNQPSAAARLVRNVRRGGGYGVFFVLANGFNWKQKCQNLKRGGGLVALNAYRQPKPGDLETLRTYRFFDVVWGRWR